VRSQPLPEDLLAGKRIALVLAALALGWAGGLAAQESPAVEVIEVVLDASTDMREPIAGVARISLAREFLTALGGGLSADGSGPPALRLYGSASPRTRRDCSDSRLVVGPGATLSQWTAALSAVQPRGVSPLAHALRQAALDSVPTYVLVTDGGDDCRADPCAVWKEVVGGGPNRRSRLHVVALDPGADRLEELRCLSRAGSGSLTVIDGAGEAASAGERVARILRNEGMIEVRATLGRDGEPLALPARVMRPVPNEVVAAFTTRAPKTVPAGVYRVVVEASPPIAFERVLVLPGETATLDATELGRLRVELLDERGMQVRAPVSIRSGDGRRELHYGVTGEDALMQAGSYRLRVVAGDSMLEARDVTVTAGRTTRYAFGGGGTLLVLSPEFESPPPTPVLAFHGEGVDTLRVGEPHSLPAGSYRLVVQTLPMYVTEDVSVRDENQTVVTLPETGILGVSLSGAQGVVTDVGVDVREALTGEVYGTILSGERRLAMPARYDLVARTVPPTTFAGIDVTPGQERIVRREGLSRVSVVPAPGAAGPYRLELFGAAGDRRLGEASGAQPALAAWPGEYLARVWRGRELLRETRVAVASDKTARIDLASP
jgi:hypothetical protein